MRVEYTKLWFNNGYAYKTCDIPLQNQGLVLLRGLNVDDGGFLGAGKTSPFEIFSHLLVGKSGKGTGRSERTFVSDVINVQSGGNYEAHLHLSVDGHKYEIVQYRNHGKYGNSFRIIDLATGDNILPSSARKHPTKWLVDNITKLDDRSLFSLVYLPQDYNNVLLSGTDSERQQSLMRMFSLDVYDDLLEKTKSMLVTDKIVLRDAEKLERELEDVNAALDSFGKSMYDLVEDLAYYRKEAERLDKEFSVGTKRLNRLQHRLREVKEYNQIQKEIEEIWSSVDFGVGSVDDIDDEYVEKLSVSYENAIKQVEQCKAALDAIGRVATLKTRLEALPDSRDKDEIEDDLKSVRKKIQKIEDVYIPNAERRIEIAEEIKALGPIPDMDITALRAQWKDLTGEIAKTEKEIDDLNRALKSDVCPTCHRPFNMSDKEVSVKKHRLAKRRAYLEKLVRQENEISKALKTADKHSKLKEKLQNIPKPPKNAPALRTMLNSLMVKEQNLVEELEAAASRMTIQAKLAELPSGNDQHKITKDKKRYEKVIKEKKTLIEAATEMISKRNRIKDLPSGDIEQLREVIHNTKLKLDRIRESKTEADRMVGNLGASVDRYDAMMKRKEKIVSGLAKMTEVRKRYKCLEALKKAFGAKGLKRIRFERILTDAVTKTVPRYSELMWPKRNVVLDLVASGTDVKVALRRKDGGPEVVSRLFSGGERNKAGLALLFGIRDLKEIYTGTSTNLLVVDEPFSNLDPQGTSSLLRILHDLRKRIGTIIVIGNQRDVFVHEDMFDQVWWAVRNEHVAELYKTGLPEKFKPYLDKSMLV